MFVDAVLAFSDDPDPVNLSRYLEASRVLEESRPNGQRRRRASRLTGPARRTHRPAVNVNDAAA